MKVAIHVEFLRLIYSSPSTQTVIARHYNVAPKEGLIVFEA